MFSVIITILLYYDSVMFIQETRDALAAQGSTDDELIAKHLRTLADMSVRCCS